MAAKLQRANFGHSGGLMGATLIDIWGDGPLVLRHAGKVWRFEFSEMFGPILLTQQWEPKVHQPDREDHPFWEAFYAWDRSGRRNRAILNRSGRLKFYLCFIGKKAEPALA